ncbi:hypothetical protein O181_020054 [Austropuccinia psidii MF-1]|uniref:Sterol 3-beta-glucosyltransferase n=1 Tax=Austropuccinia psidii MF-1 TaxID=1389203 RepID=A0A9Q3GVB7_9BASI|nr:hypothetical protein [Austropuccinia psidii MF-1]
MLKRIKTKSRSIISSSSSSEGTDEEEEEEETEEAQTDQSNNLSSSNFYSSDVNQGMFQMIQAIQLIDSQSIILKSTEENKLDESSNQAGPTLPSCSSSNSSIDNPNQSSSSKISNTRRSKTLSSSLSQFQNQNLDPESHLLNNQTQSDPDVPGALNHPIVSHPNLNSSNPSISTLSNHSDSTYQSLNLISTTPKLLTLTSRSLDSLVASSFFNPNPTTTAILPKMSKTFNIKSHKNRSTLYRHHNNRHHRYHHHHHHSHTNRKIILTKKLRQIFHLDPNEQILAEYSSWIFQSILLKGYLYLTTGHICFYAYLRNNLEKDSDDESDIIKSGMLTRIYSRKFKQITSTKSWFTLKDSILSWYSSTNQSYFPIGQIDLHFCTRVESCPSGSKHSNQFKIFLSNKVYTFASDTPQTMNDWVKVIKQSIFICKQHDQNVRIAIPLNAIDTVEKCESIQFAQTIRIKTKKFKHVSKPPGLNTPSSLSSSSSSSVSQSSSTSTTAVKNPTLIDYYFGFLHDSRTPFELIKVTLEKYNKSLVQSKALVDHQLMETAQTPPNQSFINPTRLQEQIPPSILDSTRFSPPPHQTSNLANSKSTLENTKLNIKLSTRIKKLSSSGNKFIGSPIRSASNVIKLHSSIINSLSSLGHTPGPDPSHSARLDYQPFSVTDLTGSQLADSHTYPPSSFSHYSTYQSKGKLNQSPRSSPSNLFPPTTATSDVKSWALIPGWLKNVPKTLSPVRTSEAVSSTRLTADQRVNIDHSHPDGFEGEKRCQEELITERDERKFQTDFNFLNFNPASLSNPSDQHVRMKLLLKTKCTLLRSASSIYGQVYLATMFQPALEKQEFSRQSCVCFKGQKPISNTATKMILPVDQIVELKSNSNILTLLTIQTDTLLRPEEVSFEFGSKEQIKAVKIHLLSLMRAIRQRQEGIELDERAADTHTKDEEDEDGSQLPIMFQSSSSSFLTFKPREKLHITCLTIGSRGDVQPYIALCQRLQADGHTCRIASHGEYRKWVEGYGIEYVEIGGDPAELMKICVDNGMFTLGFLKEALSKFRGWLDELLITSYEACKGTDLLIESPSTMAGIHIAECLEIPYFRAFTMPWTRTKEYPHAFAVPDHKMGGGYNYMTYTVFDQVFWRAMSGQVNKWRKETLGLKSTSWEKLEAYKVPFLYNFSPTIVPPPLDWFEWVHITGYWFIEENNHTTKQADNDEGQTASTKDKGKEKASQSSKKWEPESGLVEFLGRAKRENKKVVYIGFGSIVVPDPEAMKKVIIEAVQQAGVYAIVTKGWSERLKNDDNIETKVEEPTQGNSSGFEEGQEYKMIYHMNSVPHDWLFPKIHAACHHGGAGTTGASLRAGIPTIIKPFFGDQYFWAERVETLGIGTSVKKMTVKALSQAFKSATTDELQIKKAKLVGEQIRLECGASKAVECIYRDLEYAKSLIKRKTKKVIHSTNSIDKSKLPTFATYSCIIQPSNLPQHPSRQSSDIDNSPSNSQMFGVKSLSGVTNDSSPNENNFSSSSRSNQSQSSYDRDISPQATLRSNPIDSCNLRSNSTESDSKQPPLLSSSPSRLSSSDINKPLNGSIRNPTSDEDSSCSWDILSQSKSEPIDLSGSFDKLERS